MGHEVCGKNVYVILVRFNVRIILGYGRESLIPEGHGEHNTVRFRRRRDMFLARARQLERIRNNAVTSSSSKNSFLDGHLSIRLAMQTPTNFRVFSFAVLPDDDEINVTEPS